MTSSIGNVFLFSHLQLSRVNSAGIATGQLDPDGTLTPNTTSHAYKSLGPVTVTVPQPSYLTAIFRAGGQQLGQADMGIDQIGTGEITLADADANLMALVAGGSVDTTSITNATIFSPNSQQPTPFQLTIILTASWQSRVSASDGTNYYLTMVFPRAQCRWRMSGVTGEAGVNPNTATLTFTPTKTSKLVGGISMGANQGWFGNSEYHYWMVAQYPYALTAFIQNAAATTYVTGYRGKSSAVTNGTTTNLFTVGGVATAPTSYTIATGLVTLAAAGSSGVIDNAFYQTLFEAI